MSAFEEIDQKRRLYEREIHETYALARKPEKAAGFIARGVTGAECRAELIGRRIDLAAEMRRRHGMD
jgi:hypothetical protein